LHHPDDPLPDASAILGSVLWGLWHLPIVPPEARGLRTVYSLIGVHSLIGIPLAVFWRRSGNLVIPAFTHALIDAVRNALRVSG